MTKIVPKLQEGQLPGSEAGLEPKPDWEPRYAGSGRLDRKVAIVAGGDSGIGRAVAALFAREGANVVISYLEEEEDALRTAEMIKDEGAITAFARNLSQNLADQGIHVNGVAPGPIWTPLNPSGGASEEMLENFGNSTPMGRPGQPNEVAPCFLFLAWEDSSYMSGQVLHPNGGITVGS